MIFISRSFFVAAPKIFSALFVFALSLGAFSISGSAQQAGPSVPVVTTATCGKPVCTFNAFARSYTRATGQPQTVSSAFAVLNPNTQYTLHVQNQGVSSAVISVNGTQVFGPSDFNENVTTLDRALSLRTSNTISAELRSRPGSSLTVTVIGVDDDPPSIAETANPVANGFGWNNTNVTVSFACSDQTSGVASCPGSSVVSAEGANQIVTGTAADNAGNTAISSLSINIDKTPPTIAAIAAPAANAAGWNNTPVTVNFNCGDALSGVASCPSPTTLSSEGSGQSASGTAFDKAGNSASTSLSVNIDLTPPAISVSSPANGTTVTTSSLQLTGSVSDNLSGVASISCNGSPATVSSGSYSCNLTLISGANTIQVQARDAAGNASSTQISVTFNAGPLVPPKALFLTPNQINLLSGQSHNVLLVGDVGQIVPGATWSVSDTTVASVIPGTPAQIIAGAQGTATITASFDGLSATMTVNVFAGTSLPLGTPIWSVDPLPGNRRVQQMVRGNPLKPGDPDLYAIEGDNTLRAFTADGQQLWATQVGAPRSGVSENFPRNFDTLPMLQRASLEVRGGGSGWRTGKFFQPAALNRKPARWNRLFFPIQAGGTSNISSFLRKTVPDNNSGTINIVEVDHIAFFTQVTFSLIRIDNASGQQSWRYDFAGSPDQNIAIGPDSTVYVTESIPKCYPVSPAPYNFFLFPDINHILAIDNASGQVKFALQPPPGHATYTSIFSNGPHVFADLDQEAAIGPITVMSNGSIETLVQNKFYAETDSATIPACFPCQIAVSEQNNLQLLTIQPDGTSSAQTVQSFAFNASGCDPTQGLP